MRNFLLLALTIAVVGVSVSEACLCQQEHAQTKYCDSEYVIIAKLVRKFHGGNRTGFKFIVKKEYKMSPTGKRELQQGRFYVPSEMSSCAMPTKLRLGVPYIIMGKTANLNMCSFIKPYSEATIVERRGIGGAFKKGCACRVLPSYGKGYSDQFEGGCLWDPWNECQTRYGSCIPNRGSFTPEGNPTKCRWRKSSPYLACVNKSLNHV